MIIFSLPVFSDKLGQRALVGKVCMDCNNAVEHYKESTEESSEETKRYKFTSSPNITSLICHSKVLSFTVKVNRLLPVDRGVIKNLSTAL